MATSVAPPLQYSLDDLGAPLADVTFCVVDLETTGGAPGSDAITEVGAVKVRGGEFLGTFQTLVNPGRAIPTNICVLTGISDALVVRAPRIEAVLPALLEFMGDAVLVGHNLRFDRSFLDAALVATGRSPLTNRGVDTLALARRLLRSDVPDCKLGTLARALRLDHRPSHRALDDALATADLLHVELERAAAWGVTGLDDLVAMPKMAGHPQATKLRLTDRLPRSPGVYLMRDAQGRVIYVGKATNLRSRVRSYFSTDTRRKIGRLLEDCARIDHRRTPSTLEAAVLEIRLIQALEPRYNRQGRPKRGGCWLTLTNEAFPRLTLARNAPGDGPALGPLPSRSVGQLITEAVGDAVPLRRCTTRLSANRPAPRDGPCTAAQLGVTACPCAGLVDSARYAEAVNAAKRALTGDHEVVRGPLAERMERLAADERFEEAATTRDRLRAYVSALNRTLRCAALRRPALIRFATPDGTLVELAHGVAVRWCDPDGAWRMGEAAPEAAGPTDPLTQSLADELATVAAWIQRYGHRCRLDEVDGVWASPWPPPPTMRPVPGASGGRRRTVKRGGA
ncbi:MAG: DEDD exonuclease domain-containing protein [Microthrixaceae bacterium]